MKVSDQFPGIKLGFSTQNFLNAMPLGVGNLKEILDFASAEDYTFIELRDPSAELGEKDCRDISAYAREKNVEIIYEIHKDLFDPDFREVFDRAVRNTAVFGKPGILRSILSWSEFSADQNKAGWTREELDYITSLADSCAGAAKEQEVQFILENIVEPWFGMDEAMDWTISLQEHRWSGFSSIQPIPSCLPAGELPIPKQWLNTWKPSPDDGSQPTLSAVRKELSNPS